MAETRTIAHAQANRRRAQLFRIAVLLSLVLGIGSAGLVYWQGTRANDLSGDPGMLGFDRKETQQSEVLYGRQGELLDEWSNDIKQPGTQAFILLATGALAAVICFYAAHLCDVNADLD